MNLSEAVLQAEPRIRPYVRETPLYPSPALSRLAGAHVSVKLENLQHTGSFKVRGALNKLLCLSPEHRRLGVVAASTGNHGAAVAYGARVLGVQGKVFVPEDAAPTKLDLIRHYGADIEVYGQDCGDTEVYARRYAERHGLAYISPYNDAEVMAGQGTLGVEILRQADRVDAVFAAVGGGGLIGGMAGYMKHARPEVRIYGCSPANSAAMAASVRAGRLVDAPSEPTLSDATAGGLEPGTITFEPCARHVDGFVLVSEAEIAGAMRLVMEAHHLLIEGAAATAAAACLKHRDLPPDAHVVVVLSGGNVGLGTVRRILG
jgi:threonine dehydratase